MIVRVLSFGRRRASAPAIFMHFSNFRKLVNGFNELLDDDGSGGRNKPATLVTQAHKLLCDLESSMGSAEFMSKLESESSEELTLYANEVKKVIKRKAFAMRT